MDTVRRVNPVRRLLALLLAIIWLPATAHCSLEAVGWGFGHICASTTDTDHGTGSNCDDCAECRTVEGGYCASTVRVAVPVAPLIPALPPAVVLALLPPASGPELPVPTWSETGPPRPWQFAARAALPPRAPSFAA